MGLLSRLRGPKPLTVAEAAEAAKAGTLVLVDVREPGEWRAGHAPTAEHVPLASLGSALERLNASGRPVAFVCQSGMRSGRATRQARAAGLDARNVKGGMSAWQRAGLPVVSGKGSSKRKR